jgi:hypothetical protein
VVSEGSHSLFRSEEPRIQRREQRYTWDFLRCLAFILKIGKTSAQELSEKARKLFKIQHSSADLVIIVVVSHGSLHFGALFLHPPASLYL